MKKKQERRENLKEKERKKEEEENKWINQLKMNKTEVRIKLNKKR